MVDLDETIQGLKEAGRINGNIMRSPSIDPSTRLKAIELDVFILTTILKIKYEGNALIKGLGTLIEKSRRLQQKQNDKFENEIRGTVTALG